MNHVINKLKSFLSTNFILSLTSKTSSKCLIIIFIILTIISPPTQSLPQSKKFGAAKKFSIQNQPSTAQTVKVRFANNVIGAFSKDLKIRPLEELAAEDEIGREWLSYGPDRINTPSAKKYAQILNMIMPYQDWKSFGKFYQYGCYCFPEGQNLALGRGEPVDAIDNACKRWLNCYTCASLDGNLDQCNAETTPYSFEAIVQPDGGDAKIKCVSSGAHGTCSRAICQCDAEFVETLSKLDSLGKYDITKHRQWGMFNPDEKCMKKKKDKKSDSGSEGPNITLKTAISSHREHAQKSIKEQMESEKHPTSHGIIDSCCVLQYPNFQLYRSSSQKCCYTELKGRYETNVYHPGWEEEASYECCMDGSVAKVSSGGCERKQHNDL